MAITKEQIIRDLIPEELRINKQIKDIPSDTSKLKVKVITIDDVKKRGDIQLERAVPLKFTGIRFNKEQWLNSLKKGDVVALRPWHLGPACDIGIIKSVTATMIILTRGRRFDKVNAMSIDTHKLMITPIYEKSLAHLMIEFRKKLNV